MSTTEYKPADQSALATQPWYHGRITRETAEERLNKQKPGCYLVRHSARGPGCYALDVKYQEGIRHFLIEKSSDLYEVSGSNKQFHSIPSLLSYYTMNPLSAADMEILTRPCHKPLPITYPPRSQRQKRRAISDPRELGRSYAGLPSTFQHSWKKDHNGIKNHQAAKQHTANSTDEQKQVSFFRILCCCCF